MDQGPEQCLVRMRIRISVSTAIENPDNPTETLSSEWRCVSNNFERFIIQTKTHSCLKMHGAEVQCQLSCSAGCAMLRASACEGHITIDIVKQAALQ